MTESEAIEKLKALDGMGDTEHEHVEADDILCEFLVSLGYPALVEQFKKNAAGYWYA